MYMLNLLRKRVVVFFFNFFCLRITFLVQVKGTLYPSDTPVKTELILPYIHACFIFFQTQWKTCHYNKPLFHPGQLENYVMIEMTSYSYDTEPAAALRNLGEAVTAWMRTALGNESHL